MSTTRMCASAALALALSLACGEADPPAQPAPQAEQPPTTGPEPVPPGAEVPPFPDPKRGPDVCKLLTDADPATLLAGTPGDPWRIYGMCRVEIPGSGLEGTPERSAALEVRADREKAVPTNADEFWEREGAGAEFAGAKRDQLVELKGIGDYALWHPINGGMRLFAYWNKDWMAVVTVMGVPEVHALPWSQKLAKTAIEQPWR
jgi:hypothetical protein